MIPKIVLTGGPCGGKSSAYEYLKTRLPQLNIKPFFVPELATSLFHNGVDWNDVKWSEKLAFEFQKNMILRQIENENVFYAFANLIPVQRKVLICDRGTIDNMVYCKDEWHQDILSQVGSLGFLKRRYDGIIHLNTLAWGDGYTTENNAARRETAEEARHMDDRTYEMWKRGPSGIFHERIAHNVSLDEKLEAVAQAVNTIVDGYDKWKKP
jgi:hypothetical protein